MLVIGIDSHKDTLAGCLIDAAGRPLEQAARWPRSVAVMSAGASPSLQDAQRAAEAVADLDAGGNRRSVTTNHPN